MNKIQKLKLALSKFLAEFSAIKTDKAVLEYNEDGELAVGYNVYVTDENGEYIPVEDGEYVTEDNKTIVVADGKVAEIKEASEPEPVAEPEPVEEAVVEAEDEPVVETVEPEAPVRDLAKELDDLYEIVNSLLQEVEALKGKSEEAIIAVEEMSKMSAASPANVEIEKTASVKSGNAKLDAALAGIREASK